MGKFFNLFTANEKPAFAEELVDVLIKYVFPVLLSVVIIWAIYIGLQLAKAQDENSRAKAKRRATNSLVSLFIIVAVFSMMLGYQYGGWKGRPGGHGQGDVGNTNPLDVYNGHGPNSPGQGPGVITPQNPGEEPPVTSPTDGPVSNLDNPINQNKGPNEIRAETITSVYGEREVNNGDINSYGIDIATGEGEALVKVTSYAITGVPNYNGLQTWTPVNAVQTPYERTPEEKKEGVVSLEWQSSYPPTTAVRAVADGTLYKVGNVETANPYELAYIVIEHDEPLPGHTKTYSFYGGLYGEKMVTDYWSLFAYETHAFYNAALKRYYPPGSFFYGGKLWCQYPGWPGPGAGASMLIKGDNGGFSFPTTVMNEAGESYERGKWKEKLEQWVSEKKHISKGEFLGFAGGGLWDPGAGHTNLTAKEYIEDEQGNIIKDEIKNTTLERRVHFRIHAGSYAEPMNTAAQIAVNPNDWGTTVNPRTWFKTVQDDTSQELYLSIAALNKHREFLYHHNPKYNAQTGQISGGGGFFARLIQPLVTGGLGGVVGGGWQIDKLFDGFNLQNFITGVEDKILNITEMLNNYTVGFVDQIVGLGENFFSGFEGVISNVTSINIPASIESFGNNLFQGFGNLENIVFDMGSNLKSIGANAFNGLGNLSNFNFSGLTNLSKIGDGAFFGTALGDINLSNLTNLTQIGNNAFGNLCGTVNGLNFSGLSALSSIGNGAFSNLNFSDGFAGMLNLSGLSNLTSIGNSAFSGISGLTSFNFGNIGSLSNIMDGAFAGCSNLTNILNFPTNLQQLGRGVFEGTAALTNAIQSAVGGIASIGNWALGAVNSTVGTLGGIMTFPSQIIGIAEGAFSNQTGSFVNLTNLTGVAFAPSSLLRNISTNAFSGLTNLTGINFANLGNLASIGAGAFQNCTNLSSLTNLTSLTSLTNIMNNAFSGTGITGTLNLTGLTNLSSIMNNAFSNISGLTNINFGSIANLTNIMDGAFAGCGGLTGVLNLPSTLNHLGKNVFAGTMALTNALNSAVNGVANIGNWAVGIVDNISCLVNNVLTIPSQTNGIAEGLFTNLSPTFVSSLLGIAFDPASQLKIVGSNVFAGLKNLSSIDFRNTTGMTSIASNAFKGCFALTSLTNLPSSLNSIGENAFADLKNLSYINLPSSLNSIGACAFSGWSSAQTINFEISLSTALSIFGVNQSEWAWKLGSDAVINFDVIF